MYRLKKLVILCTAPRIQDNNPLHPCRFSNIRPPSQSHVSLNNDNMFSDIVLTPRTQPEGTQCRL